MQHQLIRFVLCQYPYRIHVELLHVHARSTHLQTSSVSAVCRRLRRFSANSIDHISSDLHTPTWLAEAVVLAALVMEGEAWLPARQIIEVEDKRQVSVLYTEIHTAASSH